MNILGDYGGFHYQASHVVSKSLYECWSNFLAVCNAVKNFYYYRCLARGGLAKGRERLQT